MSFHPYSVRPIGSVKFEEYLQDLFNTIHYNRQINQPEEKLENLAPYGKKLWNSQPKPDEWDLLLYSVIYQAMLDYEDYWCRWQKAEAEENIGYSNYWHSKCLELENYYFRRYEYTEVLFEKLLKILESGGKINSFKGKYAVGTIFKEFVYGE